MCAFCASTTGLDTTGNPTTHTCVCLYPTGFCFWVLSVKTFQYRAEIAGVKAPRNVHVNTRLISRQSKDATHWAPEMYMTIYTAARKKKKKTKKKNTILAPGHWARENESWYSKHVLLYMYLRVKGLVYVRPSIQHNPRVVIHNETEVSSPSLTTEIRGRSS